MAESLHILVIDADEADRQTCTRLLAGMSDEHFAISEAATAQEAFSALETGFPDCILLDQELPDIEGIDFIEQLRNDYPSLKIPIIMLTAQGNEEIALKAIRLGVSDYLIKGEVTVDNLRRSIKGSIQKNVLQSQLSKKNEELGKVNTILQAEQRELIDLYHTMSHELKTPVGSISAFAYMLLEDSVGPSNAKQKEYLQYILESCKQLYIYIETLLEMSRLDTGKIALKRKTASVKPLIEKAVKNTVAQATEKKLKLNYKIQNDLPEIEMDSERIYQAVINLLNNAIKFTNEGFVEVVAERYAINPEYVCITVKDTGIGIAEDKIQRVFERLFQVEAKHNTLGGLGLGLSICKSIVDLHGGWTQVQSKLGVGSAFSIMLPIRYTRNSKESAL